VQCSPQPVVVVLDQIASPAGGLAEKEGCAIILLDSDRAAYVLGFEGSMPSDSAALAGSILQW